MNAVRCGAPVMNAFNVLHQLRAHDEWEDAADEWIGTNTWTHVHPGRGLRECVEG